MVEDPNWPRAVREDTSVLVVDDDDEVTMLLSEVLASSGYRVLTANNGDLAVRLIVKEQPSVVLIDLILPGRDAYWLAVYARQVFGLRVGLVGMTGSLDEQAIALAYASGCDVVVRKPFDLATLLDAIERVRPRSPS